MTHFKIYNTVLGLCALLCLSCSEEIELTDPSAATQAEAFHTCRLYLDGDLPSFEGEASTRAANGAWEDGDMLYLHFSQGVYGQAVYSAKGSSWTVSYSGQLSATTNSNATVYFMPGTTASNGLVTLTQNTPVYTDASATYAYLANEDAVYLKAHLSSPCWRMRFKGNAGSSVTIERNESLRYYSQLDLRQGELSATQQSASLVSRSDGYTDYVYALPSDADFTLSLTTDDGSFERNFPSQHASAGQSGVLSIPTPSAHDGWTFNKVDKVAKLVDGPTFNKCIIMLANGRKLEQKEEDNWGIDEKIKSIVFEYQSDKTSTTLVSTDDSAYPIYASFEDGIITISTQAQKFQLISTALMFYGCSVLTSLDLSSFDTRNVTNMGNMFNICSALTSLDLSNFDTSNVTNMSLMFSNCLSLTSLDLSSFDTSKVGSMLMMFENSPSLTSLNLSSFDTRNVTDMRWMFNLCSSLTSLDLSSFDTKNALMMDGMFGGCSSLISLNLSNFDTRNVYIMGGMFGGCSSLISLNLSNFDTRNVYNMGGMFSGCYALTSLDLSNFDTRNVTDMSYMFCWCTALTSLDLSNFDTSNVTDMSHMFTSCTSLTSLDLSNFDTKKVKNMYQMFDGCSALTSLDLSNFDTRNVTDMGAMFDSCSALTSLNLANFDTKSVTSMGGMFNQCSALTSLDLSNFDTRNVTNMSCMFNYCSALTSLDLSNFDTRNVTDMWGMFSSCSALTSLDLSNFDTSNVTYMTEMFRDCGRLATLDLSSFDTSNVKEMDGMLYDCSGLTDLNLGYDFTMANTSKSKMCVGLANSSRACTISCISSTKDRLSESTTGLDTSKITWNLLDQNNNENDVNGSEFDDFEQW